MSPDPIIPGRCKTISGHIPPLKAIGPMYTTPFHYLAVTMAACPLKDQQRIDQIAHRDRPQAKASHRFRDIFMLWGALSYRHLSAFRSYYAYRPGWPPGWHDRAIPSQNSGPPRYW